MHKRRLFSLWLALLFLTGCHGGVSTESTNPDAEDSPTGIFTLAMRTPTTLHPLKTQQESNVPVFDLVYDSLVYVDREMRPVPYLAESCTISDDGMTISLALHDGILWHDGAAFTSADVLHTVNEIRLFGEDGIYYDRLAYIADISARDMLHLDIQLTRPHIMVLNLLDFPIVPCHRTDLDSTMVGTGQYKLESYTPQKSMTLTRNENWKLSDPPAMEKIQVEMVVHAPDAANMVKIGEVTAVATSAETIGGLGIGETMQITSYPTLEYMYIGFNLSNPLLASYRVRYAVSYGIDRMQLIEDAYLGYAQPAAVPVPPSSYLYIGADKDSIVRDTEKATALLYEDGFSETDGIMCRMQEDGALSQLRLTLLINEENEYRKTYANLIAQQLAEIGMAIEIETVPWETYLSRLASGAFDMYAGSCRLSADLSCDFLLGSGNPVQNGYVSPEMENALAALGPQRTDEALRIAYAQFQEVFLRDLPLTGIGFLEGALVHTTRLSGIEDLASSKLYRNIGKWHLE